MFEHLLRDHNVKCLKTNRLFANIIFWKIG